MKAVVDTHALIWFFENSPKLGRRARSVLIGEDSQLIIPVIVLCELYAYLRKYHRLAEYSSIYQMLAEDPRVVIVPLTPDLILSIPKTLELHDGLIAATFLAHPNAVLLSKDSEMQAWGQSAVVWDK